MTNKITESLNNATEVPEIDPRPPQYSDIALAVSFVEKYKTSLRYVAAWNKWMVWNGQYWREDDVLYAFKVSTKVCREISSCIKKQNTARAIASNKTIAAVINVARADQEIAATVDQWDTDRNALCTPGGVVDLKTGLMRATSPLDYTTKITSVVPSYDDCPLWLTFLKRITDNNPDLVNYLQRVCGYALTGETIEHALMFLYGPGGNGKGTFVQTIASVMGSYHTTSPIETFTASMHDRHPTELASLRGARLVTATETEEGRAWAESRIKVLTGGDRISARFMRQDLFEFTPQFKLIIAGNHKPGLKTVDEAIRRRMNLVPFNVRITDEEKDVRLVEKLQEEWPAVLGWMIRGCLEWQQGGLRPPNTVTEATSKYLAGEDASTTWFEDCCKADPQAFTPIAELFLSWRNWATNAGSWVGSEKKFSQFLEGKGFTPNRQWIERGNNRLKIRGFIGLKLTYAPRAFDEGFWEHSGNFTEQ